MLRVALCLLLLLSGPAARGQAQLDATLATVNGDLILKSDVLWNLALDPTVRPDEFWAPQVQSLMLRTLVDQRLLLQEALKLPATQATEEEVAAYKAELAGKFNSLNDDDLRFERRQVLVGLTGPRLDRIVREQLQILKFIDFRFRSFVVVTEPEIVRYFELEVKPKLADQTEAALAATLAAEREKIVRVLTEEKISSATDTFLEEARARADVVIYGE